MFTMKNQAVLYANIPYLEPKWPFIRKKWRSAIQSKAKIPTKTRLLRSFQVQRSHSFMKTVLPFSSQMWPPGLLEKGLEFNWGNFWNQELSHPPKKKTKYEQITLEKKQNTSTQYELDK